MEKKRPIQFDILNEAWKLIKKYSDKDDSQVSGVHNDIGAFSTRYGHTKFANDIALAIAFEIERIVTKNTENKHGKTN